jgi:hypothetical protein
LGHFLSFSGNLLLRGIWVLFEEVAPRLVPWSGLLLVVALDHDAIARGDELWSNAL